MSETADGGTAAADGAEHAEGEESAEPDAPDRAEGDEQPTAAAEVADAESAPEVELGVYQLSVRVKGSEGDGLRDVEDAATRLVDHLVERAGTLEEDPDERGLG